MQLCNNGHCCIPEMALVDKTAKILQVNNQIIFTILKERIDNGSLNTEVVGGETLIYPPYSAGAEKVATRLLQLQQATEPLSEDNFLIYQSMGKRQSNPTCTKTKRSHQKLSSSRSFSPYWC